MGGDFDDLTSALLSVPPPAAPAAQSTSQTPAAPQAASPQPPATPEAQPQPAPAPAPAVPQAQPQAQPPAASNPQVGAQPSDPVEAVLAEMQTKEAELYNQILPAFALSPELVAEMETDAVNAVPKVLAQTFMKSVSTSLKYMQQIVPHMIARAVAQRDASQAVERAFFGKFGQLNAEKHGADIVAFADMFRKQNPNISQEDLFARTGAAVMAMHGITPGTVASIAQQPGVVAVTPVNPQQPTPFVPAATGGAVVAKPQVADSTGFLGMGRDYD